MLDWASKYPGECISCGFLGQYQSGAPGILLDIHAGYRASGKMSANNGLWCLRRAADLQGEVADRFRELGEMEPLGEYAPDDSPLYHARRKVMQQSARNCPEWYEWVEYFDPKWHYEDWRMRQLDEARRVNDLKIAEIDQRTQQAILKMMEEQTKIATALKDTAASNERQTTRFNHLFLIVGVAALLLAVAAFAYPNGATWVVDHAPGAERHAEATAIPLSTPSTASTPP